MRECEKWNIGAQLCASQPHLLVGTKTRESESDTEESLYASKIKPETSAFYILVRLSVVSRSIQTVDSRATCSHTVNTHKQNTPIYSEASTNLSVFDFGKNSLSVSYNMKCDM